MLRKESEKRIAVLQETVDQISIKLNKTLTLSEQVHEQSCTAKMNFSKKLEELVKNAEEQEKVQNERYNKIHYCNVASIALLFAIIAMFIFQYLKINALTNQIAECENQIAECQTLITNQVSDDAEARFLEAVLPMGNREMRDVSKNKYYYDRDCQYEIVNPVFSTGDYDYVTGNDSEGNSVRIYRLTNGSFAYTRAEYSTEFENLNRADEWYD